MKKISFYLLVCFFYALIPVQIQATCLPTITNDGGREDDVPCNGSQLRKRVYYSLRWTDNRYDPNGEFLVSETGDCLYTWNTCCSLIYNAPNECWPQFDTPQLLDGVFKQTTRRGHCDHSDVSCPLTCSNRPVYTGLHWGVDNVQKWNHSCSTACLNVNGSNGFAADYENYPVNGCEDD